MVVEALQDFQNPTRLHGAGLGTTPPIKALILRHDWILMCNGCFQNQEMNMNMTQWVAYWTAILEVSFSVCTADDMTEYGQHWELAECPGSVLHEGFSFAGRFHNLFLSPVQALQWRIKGHWGFPLTARVGSFNFLVDWGAPRVDTKFAKLCFSRKSPVKAQACPCLHPCLVPSLRFKNCMCMSILCGRLSIQK